MKVLFLVGYKINIDNGVATFGGWVNTLMKCLSDTNKVSLSISYPSCKNEVKIIDNIEYRPVKIPIQTRILRKVFTTNGFSKFGEKIFDGEFISALNIVINDYQPDIIHVWGCEFPMGLVAKNTKIPVVIHIQGILNAIKFANFPQGLNLYNILFSRHFYKFFKYKANYNSLFKYSLERETDICRNIKYFIGRTEWDRNVISILSPNSHYYYGEEMLRNQILLSNKWKWHNRHHLVISSVIRESWYKGQDVILRTSKFLKEVLENDFEWNIYGVSNIADFEIITGIKAINTNVYCKGIANTKTLVDALLNSDVMCHLSYIENSPNCVCEAQYLGVPVIASNAGGTSTMLSNNSGILVPINDCIQTAAQIIKVKKDKQYAEILSNNEIKEAECRHDNNNIIDNLLNTYENIIQITNKKFKS